MVIHFYQFLSAVNVRLANYQINARRYYQSDTDLFKPIDQSAEAVEYTDCTSAVR